MNSSIAWVISLLLTAGGMLAFFFVKRKRLDSSAAMQGSLTVTASRAEPNAASVTDLAFHDETGRNVITANEIAGIPAHAQTLRDSSSVSRQSMHLVSELLKGSASVPNKTVELVFSKEVQQGLTAGTNKLMESGGHNFADAVSVQTGKIVGKGRLIESGKLKQVAGGIFQLASIAVAQSHLDDINQSLGAIQKSVDGVLAKMEIADRSDIQGTIDYLKEMADYMRALKSPDELPEQKRTKLEDILLESHKWRAKIHGEMSKLVQDIKAQADLDTFGTEKTYKALSDLIAKAAPLNERHKLLLDVVTLMNMLFAYLDPLGHQHRKVEPRLDEWHELVQRLKDESQEKATALLTRARFNSDEMLEHRRNAVIGQGRQSEILALSNQKTYSDVLQRIEASQRRLVKEGGELRVAITFDAAGQVKTTAIL